MKAILLATVETTSLQLLIEVEDDKATANYFLNGIQVTTWDAIKPIYQKVLLALLDDYCNSNKLIKWSY